MRNSINIRLLGVLLLLGGSQWASAQSRQSCLGLKLGGSSSSFGGRDAQGDGRLGLGAGLILHLPVSSAFSVQPEFLYVQKGADAQPFLVYGNSVQGSQRLHYAEVPVLAKLRSRSGLFVEAGPTLSYLLSASATLPNLAGNQVTLDSRGSFNSFDWGFALGGGVQWAQGLLLGLRYGGGLSAAPRAGSYSGINGAPRIYNRSFQLYLGYIFFNRPRPEFSN